MPFPAFIIDRSSKTQMSITASIEPSLPGFRFGYSISAGGRTASWTEVRRFLHSEVVTSFAYISLELTPEEASKEYCAIGVFWYPASITSQNTWEINPHILGSASSTHYPPFSVADFNAAVQANVNAVLGTYQNQINNLNAQIQQMQQNGNVNLLALEQSGEIFRPKRRAGDFTLKDFTVLHAVYQVGTPLTFLKQDLDFIAVQMLSLQQAMQKMRWVALAMDNNLPVSVIHRPRSNRLKEYTAKAGPDFKDFLMESSRVMEYAVNEIRNLQRFNVPSPFLLREIEPK